MTELPRKMPTKGGRIEKLKKEIEAEGFTCTHISMHEGWRVAQIDGDMVLKGRYLDDTHEGPGVYSLWLEKWRGRPAVAPAPPEPPQEPAKAPEEPAVEMVDFVHPATGQQSIPTVNRIPRQLSDLVHEEYHKKQIFVSANNDFQEARKDLNEELELPMYDALFKPHPKIKGKSLMVIADLVLYRNDTTNRSHKTDKATDEDRAIWDGLNTDEG